MFISNIPLSFSANYFCRLPQGEKRTFRAYVKPTVTGRFDWCFRYRNTVSSTWDNGAVSRADMPGGRFAILHAACCACDGEKQVLSCHPVTFHGSPSLEVMPNDLFTTDPVSLSIPENGYLMFNWCIQSPEDNAILPGTPNSQGWCLLGETDEDPLAPDSTLRMADEDLEECCVMPQLWLADRSVRYTVAFIGDSITQGCQTRMDHYEQWATHIIRGLPRDTAGFNIGLGYARAQDAALNGTWLEQLRGCDVVNVCLGVNDIFQMTETEDHADVLTRNLTRTVSAIRQNTPGVRIVLFTVPPFSMEGAYETVRSTVNARIRESMLGADAVFDMDILMVPDTAGQARFGDHPDGIGGAVVAGEYLTRFLPQHRHILFPENG